MRIFDGDSGEASYSVVIESSAGTIFKNSSGQTILTCRVYKGLEDISIDKYCSQIDILPTILNLFGVEYDSRLLLGRDIMSDSISPIIFQNRSFITEKGKYNAITEVLNELQVGFARGN